MSVGPFAPYPAKVSELDRIAGQISVNGTTLSGVGEDAARHGHRAGSYESFGFESAVHAAVRPSTRDGGLLDSAARLAKSALGAWASEVREYDRAMDQLNSLWAVAKADNFGVDATYTGGPQPGGADSVGRARTAAFGVLQQLQRKAEQRLDDSADAVAAALNAGPEASNGVTVAVYSGDGSGYNPYGSWGTAVPNSGVQQVGLFDDVWDGVTEGFKFLVGDPAECFGDGATPGGCGLEAAAILPWGKWLKLRKLKKLDDATDDVPKPRRETPKEPYDNSGSRGSTGRTKPRNLGEELAMEEARANPDAGKRVPLKLGDTRWPPEDGWVKMARNVNGHEIHYVRNTRTGEVDDFKFASGG